MLKVSRQPSGEPEIFYSLQGEGVTAGTPTVFLRLANCNLSCSWCDTKYTWDWESYDSRREVMELSDDDAHERILAFECRHLVITGGEPLMQQRALGSVVSRLASQGFFCEVETNGTLEPTLQMTKAMGSVVSRLASQGFFCEVETNGTLEPTLQMTKAIAQWNVSPKLANSANKASRREVPDALRAFRDLDNAYFKFVVAEPADVDEVCQLIERHNLPSCRVLLMPEGTTPRVVSDRGKWVAQACADRGFRFTTRHHILLWGDERGR